MRVSEAMTRDVRVATPGQPIREVARTMAEIDAGAMPVGENDRLADRSRDAAESNSGDDRQCAVIRMEIG